MKITKELKQLSEQELASRLQEFKKELLKLNVQVASGANTSNPGKLKQTKKNIARILTVLREKEVQGK
jgi:large subunit ribosomal protein L29